LVIGYWLLVIGYWLLVIGYWLLVIGCWLFVGAGFPRPILILEVKVGWVERSKTQL